MDDRAGSHSVAVSEPSGDSKKGEMVLNQTIDLIRSLFRYQMW